MRHHWTPTEFKGKAKMPVRWKCCCDVEKVINVGPISESYTYYVVPGNPDHLRTAPSCTGPSNQVSLFSNSQSSML